MSLVVLSAMFMVFFLSMPGFVLSTAGCVFIGIWTLLGMTSFMAYGSAIHRKGQRQYIPAWGIKKVEHTTRVRSTNWMRGL